MGDRAGSSPVARTNKKHPIRGAFYWLEIQDENPSKCGADEHRRRGLDRAAPLFSFPSGKENANRVLSSIFSLMGKRMQIESCHPPDRKKPNPISMRQSGGLLLTDSLMAAAIRKHDLLRQPG